MPLPFLVAAGIAAIGAGVGAIANETRREKEERERKNSLEYRIRNGTYSTVEISLFEAVESNLKKSRK